jgi:hypothetical protein
VTYYLGRMIRREDRRRQHMRCTLTRGTHPNVVTVATDLQCLFRPSQRASEDVGSGGRQLGLHQYDGQFDITVDVRRGDVATITRARDPQMIGRWLTIKEATIDGELTSKKVVAEESVA